MWVVIVLSNIVDWFEDFFSWLWFKGGGFVGFEMLMVKRRRVFNGIDWVDEDD